MSDRKCWKFYFVVVAILFYASGVYAQDAKKECTVEKFNAQDKDCELFTLRVQVKQQAAALAQVQYQQSINSLSQTSEQVKTDNKWAEGVRYDINSGRFINPATVTPKNPPAPEKPKDPAPSPAPPKAPEVKPSTVKPPAAKPPAPKK